MINPWRSMALHLKGPVCAATLAMLATPAFPQALSQVAVGAPAPDFALAGADGQTHRLSDYRGKVVVLEWTSPVCPFTAHAYKTKAMQKVQTQAAGQRAVWLSVNTSSPGRPGFLTKDQASARIKTLGAKVKAFLFDTGGVVGRLYGARATPALYVVGKDGRVVYEGAFDDDAGGTGVVRHIYVAEALAALRAGRPVTTPETRQYGCPVEY
jgi:peroxiredoxin